MAEWDTLELLADIRGRGGVPAADIRYTDAKLLAAATLELRDVVAALLVESQSDRGVQVASLAVVAGQAEYRLSSRALAGRWQSVAYADGAGSLQRLRHLHSSAYYQQSETARGRPSGFFVRESTLVLVPTPADAGRLVVPYYARPNKLVLPSAAGVVAAWDGTSATLADVPAGFSSGARYDVVKATPGFETLAAGLVGTLTGSVLTFPAAVAGVELGDYVALAGEAPVAQCPVELRGLLAARTARRALKGADDGNGAAMLDADVAELTEQARTLLAPRADDEPQEWGDSRRGLLWGVLR